MHGSPEEGFDAVVVQKVGPVKATFKGSVELQDMVAPLSVKIVGEGKGGAAGFAKGGADVRLEPIETGTRLHYDVDAKVGGKLAQLGSRIIDGFAKKMADQFFTKFQETIEGPVPEGGGPDAGGDTTDAAADEGGKKKGWLKKLVS
jgi:carbon monoxide dehydrogenase subunit G